MRNASLDGRRALPGRVRGARSARRWLALARRVKACAAATLLGAPLAHGAEPPPPLADLSLEQLSAIVVTTVSRSREPLAGAPASVFVITNDDIRRSGAKTLPEALRLAPNLQIARADANQYAIGARGFGNVLANRMLVMIDGRTLYSPLFSGVFWEAQDVLLEDVDRIEVVSGPGTTLWGTNAVDGVINVITKPAGETQGTLLVAGGGNTQWDAAARYGGALANGGHYRAYAKTRGIEPTERADRSSVMDRSRLTQAGFRADWQNARDAYTVQGDAYDGSADQGPAIDRDIRGANLLGRWQRVAADATGFTVQSYWDHTEREHTGTFLERLDTFDLEAQYALRPLPSHFVVTGGGYRYQRDRVTNSAAQAFIPPDRTLATAYAFVQDEFALRPELRLIGGIKAEHNEFTGFEWLPNVRLRWSPSPEHMLWAAVSRAVRAPSRFDRELFVPGVAPFALKASPDFRSEVSNVYEIGVRGQPSQRLSYSATLFHEQHDRLRSLEPAPGGGFVWGNGIEGHTSGVEAWATLHVLDRWRLSAGGTWMHEDLHPAPGSNDRGGVPLLGNDPRYSGLVRSSHDLTDRLELDVIVRFEGRRPQPDVPAYVAVDARLGYRVDPKTEVAVSFENLTDPAHAEWGAAPTRVEFRRAFYVKLLHRL